MGRDRLFSEGRGRELHQETEFLDLAADTPPLQTGPPIEEHRGTFKDNYNKTKVGCLQGHPVNQHFTELETFSRITMLRFGSATLPTRTLQCRSPDEQEVSRLDGPGSLKQAGQKRTSVSDSVLVRTIRTS